MIVGETNEERAALTVHVACMMELDAMREALHAARPELVERTYWRPLEDGRRGVELCVSKRSRLDDMPPDFERAVGAVWVVGEVDHTTKTVDLTVQSEVYEETNDGE